MCIYQDVRKKWGLSHRNPPKNRAIRILFVEKRGPIIYLAALKKGAIRDAQPYYAIYRKLPAPAPPTPPPPPRFSGFLGGAIHVSVHCVLCIKFDVRLKEHCESISVYDIKLTEDI